MTQEEYANNVTYTTPYSNTLHFHCHINVTYVHVHQTGYIMTASTHPSITHDCVNIVNT